MKICAIKNNNRNSEVDFTVQRLSLSRTVLTLWFVWCLITRHECSYEVLPPDLPPARSVSTPPGVGLCRRLWENPPASFSRARDAAGGWFCAQKVGAYSMGVLAVSLFKQLDVGSMRSPNTILQSWLTLPCVLQGRRYKHRMLLFLGFIRCYSSMIQYKR